MSQRALDFQDSTADGSSPYRDRVQSHSGGPSAAFIPDLAIKRLAANLPGAQAWVVAVALTFAKCDDLGRWSVVFSERTMAKRAGVDKMTVSRAKRALTRLGLARVVEFADPEHQLADVLDLSPLMNKETEQ